jgi:hypothetical protein
MLGFLQIIMKAVAPSPGYPDGFFGYNLVGLLGVYRAWHCGLSPRCVLIFND